ncbi:opticin isoform X1 [Sphaerodactylus townsendi]|nr:opticin isoform X1 [Sphaerodactylus townsendi]XP_048351709.1 opticin isoform X1 [Sphaerodactylus townsendi]XP_048351710.1 opticin isoform X1 [Sphaerodactylus townsendi]
MQPAVLMSAISALAFALAPAALSKENGKEKKLKTDIPSYNILDLDSDDLSLDNYGGIIDLSNYEDIYDYGDLASKIEVDTLAPLSKHFPQSLSTTVPVEAPQSKPPSSTAARAKGPGLFGSISNQGLPTCLVCVCIRTSVYCDDTDLEDVPPLPLETVYFYARFNRINRILASDFTGLAKLKRIDLTNNFVSWVDEDSFRLLPSLQELILPENKLTSLPELPSGIIQLDARFNMIQSSGIRPEAFQDLKKLQFLYLADNKLDYIPVPLPEGLRSLHLQNNNIQTMHEDAFCNSRDHNYIRWALEDIRLDGNPINLSLFPDAYFCLPHLPTGRFY